MELYDLEVYKLAREVSDDGWQLYEKFHWQDKKIFGDQFITSIDSVGANIAEGFGRFHYLDRNKFNYNARGSLLESMHWLSLLFKRNKIKEKEFNVLDVKLRNLSVKLNNYIYSTKKIKYAAQSTMVSQ